MTAPAKHDGVFLVCDGCHQDYVRHRERATQDALKAAVEKQAVAAGWKLSAGQAFCPACSKRSVN